MRHSASRSTTPNRQERAALVGLFNSASHFDPEHSLDELAGLASAAGAASGVALGLDRLVMLAAGATHIEQVMWVPVAEL